MSLADPSRRAVEPPADDEAGRSAVACAQATAPATPA